jgi:hypothetical protein
MFCFPKSTPFFQKVSYSFLELWVHPGVLRSGERKLKDAKVWGLWHKASGNWLVANGEIVVRTTRAEATLLAQAIAGYVVRDLDLKRCCLCGDEIVGHGHRPWPLATSGEACDECNDAVVEARLFLLRGP